MIVSQKTYDYTVRFNSVRNRWEAVFESLIVSGLSFSFPLPDFSFFRDDTRSGVGTSRAPGPTLAVGEEALLALTFNQMATFYAAQTAAAAIPEIPMSESEVELTP